MAKKKKKPKKPRNWTALSAILRPKQVFTSRKDKRKGNKERIIEEDE